MKKKLLDFLTPLKLIIYGNMCSVSPSVFLSNLHIVIFIENTFITCKMIDNQ